MKASSPPSQAAASTPLAGGRGCEGKRHEAHALHQTWQVSVSDSLLGWSCWRLRELTFFAVRDLEACEKDTEAYGWRAAFVACPATATRTCQETCHCAWSAAEPSQSHQHLTAWVIAAPILVDSSALVAAECSMPAAQPPITTALTSPCGTGESHLHTDHRRVWSSAAR